MKRIFLARRNAVLSAADISWGAYALVFALLFLLFRLLAPNLFWHALSPVFGGADALASNTRSFFASFENAATLAAQVDALREQNAALVALNQALAAKAAETATLPSMGIIAGVVARPPESPYDTLVVAAGTSAGVAAGQEVFGAGGVPLGVVSSVSADFSRVTLFSAPGMRMHGTVGSANTAVTLLGAGGGTFVATVSRLAAIAAGDNVFVGGPGALPVGTIRRVDSDPSSPAVTLQILPALLPFTINWVVLRDTGAAFLNTLRTATSTPL